MTPVIPTTGTTARTGNVNNVGNVVAAASMVRGNNVPINTQQSVTVVNNEMVGIPYVDDRYFIVSIYPEPLFYQLRQGDVRNGGRGVTMYSMPAAKRGEYKVLEIAPTIAWKQNFESGFDQPSSGLVPVVTSAKKNAEALVHLWTSGSQISIGRPGIAMVPEGVVEGTRPFMEFLTKLITQQELYFTAIVEEAQASYMRGDKIQAVDRAVAAAFWLAGDNAKQYEWVGRKTFVVNKNCPACTKPIPQAAIRCTECNTDLIKFYTDYKVDASKSDTVVYLYQECIKAGRFPSQAMVTRVLETGDVETVVMEVLEQEAQEIQKQQTKKPSGK